MRPRFALSLGNFFVAGHFFLVLYSAAPYLATLVSEKLVGLVISLGALLTLVTFPFVPQLVRKVGSRRLALGTGVLSACFLLILALQPSPVIALMVVALFFAVAPIGAYFMDLLLEATIEHEAATGRVRTLFITCGNIALVCAPLAVGILLGATDMYIRVFIAAVAMLAPFFLIFVFVRIPEGEPPAFRHMKDVAHCLVKDPDFRAVGLAYGVLQYFYHLAPFFIPLYLHTELGIPWSELGWIFAVMLLPFFLLEYPAGWLADHLTGDKEIMALGFFVLGASFAAVAFITVLTPVVSIVIVLVLTRVGAALAEAMCETHFFRRVSERDANSVGVFRMLRPMGSLLAPLTGSALLFLGGYNILFFVTGIAILIAGVTAALSIKDVR